MDPKDAPKSNCSDQIWLSFWAAYGHILLSLYLLVSGMSTYLFVSHIEVQQQFNMKGSILRCFFFV